MNLVMIGALIYGDPCLIYFSVLKVTASKLALKRKKTSSSMHLHVAVHEKGEFD